MTRSPIPSSSKYCFTSSKDIGTHLLFLFFSSLHYSQSLSGSKSAFPGTKTGTKGQLPRQSFRTCSFAFLLRDRKSTRLNSSHVSTSYAVFCLKKKNKHEYLIGSPHVFQIGRFNRRS